MVGEDLLGFEIGEFLIAGITQKQRALRPSPTNTIASRGMLILLLITLRPLPVGIIKMDIWESP